MPQPPVDLTEYSHLADIPGMLRQMGVPYTQPNAQLPSVSQAAPAASIPMLLQYLSAIAPWALMGGAGLAQGGSSDPAAARFYQQRPMQMQRAGERGQMPMGTPRSQPPGPHGLLMKELLRRQPPRRFGPAPRQPFAF